MRLRAKATETYDLPKGKYSIVKSPIEDDKGVCLTDGTNYFLPMIVWMVYRDGGWVFSPTDETTGQIENDAATQIWVDYSLSEVKKKGKKKS